MAGSKINDRVQNRLLAALPEKESKRLRAKAERVRLNVRDVLYQPEKPIKDVYFVEDGVVSLVSRMADGGTVEIATVGNEGMIGLPVFLGASTSPLQAFAQVPGGAWKVSAADFRQALDHGSSALAQALHRYTQALFVQLSMSVACNRLHSVQQRCARWLLITSDRVDRSEFALTQEFLAQMLGVRRASANEALQNFKRKGFLDYRQGKMKIKNRKGLESAACECYFITRDEYQRLTGS
ncbi:MAG TPA: Crp/Fnr family transcriptional regulator [Terriglobales bacterium]|nr:Crp/Fnr family transcriptional regulator [Terriglobales bacterium]